MVKQRVIAMFPRIFAIVAVLVILGAALGAGSALAAKGGIKGKPDGNGHGGNGGNGGNGTAATLVLDPDPTACCGAMFSGSGSGYIPSSFAYVNVHKPRSLGSFSIATDASGNIYFEQATAEPGTYTVEVFQYKRKKLVLMATAELVVTQ